MPTDKLFTGQQREPQAVSELGLYNYRARFYSTLVGRFVSPDPLLEELNAYSYVGNNPLKYVDPMGLCFTMPDGSTPNCDRGLWLFTIGCALHGGTACAMEDFDVDQMQTLARKAIRQDEFWNHAWNWYLDIGWDFVEIIAKGRHALGGAGFSASSEWVPAQLLESLTNQFNLVPEHGWKVLGGFFGVPGEFFKKSLYDMTAGTAKIARLGPDSIIGASPWWLDDEKGEYLRVMYGIPWNARGRDLEDVLRWKTMDLADKFRNVGDINELSWSPWQRETLHGKYGVNLAEPARGMPPPCAALGSCIPPLPRGLPQIGDIGRK
jgi:RHS repeat-associated protein